MNVAYPLRFAELHAGLGLWLRAEVATVVDVAATPTGDTGDSVAVGVLVGVFVDVLNNDVGVTVCVGVFVSVANGSTVFVAVGP